MTIIAQAAYILCSLTALSCAALLLRAYRGTGFRLLLWSGVCFAALSLENGLLFIDRVMLPDIDLGVLRNGVALMGLLGLLYGLIWDVQRR